MDKMSDKNLAVMTKIVVESLTAFIQQEVEVSLSSMTVEFENHSAKYNLAELVEMTLEQLNLRIDEDKEQRAAAVTPASNKYS